MAVRPEPTTVGRNVRARNGPLLLPLIVLLAGCSGGEGQRSSTATASHGGSKIAFEFLVQNESDPDPDVVSSADTEVYVINPDGIGLLRLTDNFSADGSPRWSPDSTRIAFVTLESRLFVSEADGSRQARLSNNAYGALDLFDWSPDGSMIVYSGFKKGRNVSDLWISKADGSGTTMLPVRDLKSVHSPVWSPDGARIAFEGIAKGKHPPGGLYLVKSDGGKAVMLARGNVTRARWSPDGTTVSFIRDSPQPGIYVVNSDGGGLRRLTDGKFEDEHVWSPDGEKIAFVRYRHQLDFGGTIYAVRIDTGELFALTVGLPSRKPR